MRSATGGEAAMVRIIPATISTPSAASSQRSTVHHQFARTVRCARDTIASFSPSVRSGVARRRSVEGEC